ncbi:MAG: DNA-binding protein [Candidatus Odinarchaeota archaeon]|nr:DNA-binding protein [Candidatus Odinarchaeota archaeon]
MFLMSVKPKYAKMILEKTKKYELRKKVPYLPRNTRIVMYASGREKRVVGEFKVGFVYLLPIKELWKLIENDGGVSREEFFYYFRGYKEGYAIEIRDPKEYKNKPTLEELREILGKDFQPPINFMKVTGKLKLFLNSIN